MRYFLFVFASFLLFFATVAAQNDDCSTIPQEAFALTTELCADVGINQLCYGYAQLEAEAQPDADDFEFNVPGDRVDVAAVRSLHSSPMNLEESLWGVSVMRLQADLEGTMPGQAVTFLLFGETSLEANDDPDEDNTLRAFYFRSGIGDSRCEEAPHSGILIRTPEGAGSIHLALNEVEIALGSTAFLQAEAGGDLTVNMLEGIGRITSQGETTTALMNMRVRVPLDENLVAAGPPSPPEACDVNDMQSLPYEQQMDCGHVGIILDESCPSRLYIPYGMFIVVNSGYGYHSLEEAQADYETYSPTISLDGVVMADEVSSIEQSGAYWGYGLQFDWGEPQPGDYILTGEGPHPSHMGRGDTRICEVTVMESPE